MRVAFDEQIFAIQRHGGISRYFTELRRIFVEDSSLGIAVNPLTLPTINTYLHQDPTLPQASSPFSSLAQYWIKPRKVRHVDVVHETFYLPNGLTRYPGARRVVTVHDMIPEVLPETRRRLDFLTRKRNRVMSADHVICISWATKRDLDAVYGDLPVPVSVIHDGVDPMFRPGRSRLPTLPRKYILYVGQRKGYKDASTLYEAFSAIQRVDNDLQLVCVGGGPFSLQERTLLDHLGVSQRVHQVDLSEVELAAAYANAEMFVFPSRYEGFGLPVLEAMASGTPAVLARAASLPEVGGDAAAYFEPGNASELAEVMETLLTDGAWAHDLRKAGVARAAQFTWRATAERTAEVYQSVLDSPSRR